MNNQNGKTTAAVISTILLVLAFGLKVARVVMRSANHRSTRSDTEFVDKIRAKAYLRTFVDTINYYRCPYAESFGRVDSFQYNEGNVLVHITLDEASANCIWAIQSNEEKVIESFLTMYSHPRLFQRALLEVLSEAGAGMTLDFKSENNNESCLLYVRPYQVSEAVKDTNVSAMDYILAENELLNTRVEGIQKDSHFKEVAIEGDYRVYHYQCEDYTISYLNSIRNKRKREILKSYKDSDGEDFVKEAGLGIKYVFENDVSGKKCVITIENDEL